MSAPSPTLISPRPEREKESRELPEVHVRIPAEKTKAQQQPALNEAVPEDLLASLTSSGMNTHRHRIHHQHCKDGGITRPDAVWSHPIGRKKYKYFLEQPVSLRGAGRDISFLCDTLTTHKKSRRLPPLDDRSNNTETQDLSVSESLIPEEYCIMQNKGLQALELYEDAFTVQLQDDEQKLQAFPSLRPSGRLEVVQLMRIMDDMLEKAGVDQQSEQLSELSQMQSLLELVQVEQNIYNVVFHELIRQVSVGCAERGQLLAKLRQRYQSLMERIPRSLKALHTEALAQRALDRRLVEEILQIKTSIQQLNKELSRIREHDAFVTQQAANAQEQLANALDQTCSNSDVVQGYHELYKLQRHRMEAQLQQLTKERDCWSRLTFSFALKVISKKKLHLVSRLHESERSWSKLAEHCTIFLSSKDTEDMNVIVDCTDLWKEQLTCFVSQLNKSEDSQRDGLQSIQRNITKWLMFCSKQKQNPDLKYEKDTEGNIYSEVEQWSNTLTLQLERYKGEDLVSCQDKLSDLSRKQEKWINVGLQLFRRHHTTTGSPPEGHQALLDLDKMISEFHNQLDTRITGETGIHRHTMELVKSMESWVTKFKATVGCQDRMPVSDWLKLEKALCSWQNSSEAALQCLSSRETEKEKSVHQSSDGKKMEDVLASVQEFVKNQSNFFDCEDQRLCDEVGSIHMGLTRWMLDLLLFIVPDHSEDQHLDYGLDLSTVSLLELEENAIMLCQKLEYFSRYIASACHLILEEQIQRNPHQNETENEINECNNMQREARDWVETCRILLSDVKGGPVDLFVRHPDTSLSSQVPVSPADSMQSQVNEDVSPIVRHSYGQDQTDTDTEQGTAECQEPEKQDGTGQVELVVCESAVLRQISYDGSITERILGEKSMLLNGSELVPSPVTDETQKAYDDLTTVGLLQRELHDSELLVQSAEQRARNAEEALQAALGKIQELEKQLQEKMKIPEPSTPGKPTTATPTKTSDEAKSSRKKTKKY